MSTEFCCVPPVTWEKFLTIKSLTLEESENKMYVMPHRLMRSDKGTLWAFRDKETGYVQFERFGRQNPELLYKVMEEFNVTINDEYGLIWPDESGG